MHQPLSNLNLNLDEEQQHHQQGQLEDVVMEELIPTSNNANEDTFYDHKSVEEDIVAPKEQQVTLGALIWFFVLSKLFC